MSAAAFQTQVATPTNLSQPELWLERYGNYLFRHALFRVRDRQLAEDIVQETLLAAVSSRDSFAGLSNEKTWLVGILKHKTLDYFRRSQNLLSLTTDDAEDYFDEEGTWRAELQPRSWSNPATLLENKDCQRVICECLNQLPERQRRVFLLREVDGLSSKEICELLDLTPGNLSVTLHRTRLKLQSLIAGKW